MRTRARDHSVAQPLILVAANERCLFCGARLKICEWRQRYVQTLPRLIDLTAKCKKCPAAGCPHPEVRYRPSEEGRLVLKGHEFGLDVVVFAGEHYHREHVSIPKIHKLLLEERRVPICESSIGNLIGDYEALCECVAADTDRLRARLKQQGAIVLSIDGVHYDDRSPVLYVQREVLSGEVLYAERRLARAAKDLVPMLQHTVDLARQIGVPILGVVSDKERSLLPAIAEVFRGVPHQFCQQHFLGNLARPLDADTERLEEGAREAVLALRDVQRHIERQFPASVSDDAERAGEPAPAGRTAREPANKPTSPSASTPEATATKPPLHTRASGRKPDPAPEAPTLNGSDAPLPAASVAALMTTAIEAPARHAKREAEVATALARAGATVGKVSGRPSVDPAGLKRFERLQAVRAAAEKASKRRGGPPGGWPLIGKVLASLAPLDELRAVANRVSRHVGIIRRVAHIFQSENSSTQVKRVLRTYLNRIAKKSPRRGRGAVTGHFIDHVLQVSSRYWPGLFHCYDHPEIPRTTNALEGFFGSSKRGVRQRTGRKSTAGGRLESCGEVIVRLQALLQTMPPGTLGAHLTAVSPETYRQTRQRLDRLREPARQRRSIQRDPQRYLDRILGQWLDTS